MRTSVKMLLAAIVLFASTSPVMATLTLADGGVHNIDYVVNELVRVDFESPGMGTTLNLLEGGSIVPILYGFEDSIINMSGGLVGRLYTSGSSQVTVSGGSIKGSLYASKSGQVTISGGGIGGELEVGNDGVITIDGSDFAVDGEPVGYIELTSILGSYNNEPWRRLRGTLLNGDPLDNDFRIVHNAKIVLVPEPATLLLLGLGGLGLVRKRSV